MATEKKYTIAEIRAMDAVENALHDDLAAARDEYKRTAEVETAVADARKVLESDKSNTLTKRVRDMAIKTVTLGLDIPTASALLYDAMCQVAPTNEEGKPKTGTAKAFTSAFRGWAAMAKDELDGEDVDASEATANAAMEYIASPEAKALKALRKELSQMLASRKDQAAALKAAIQTVSQLEEKETKPKSARKAA